MSHPLQTLLPSLFVKCSCLLVGVLSLKRAVNKEYLKEKQLLTSLFQLKGKNRKKNYSPHFGILGSPHFGIVG